MKKIVVLAAFLCWPLAVLAQDLTIGTVTRLPFSMKNGEQDTGFSVDLWKAVAERNGFDYRFRRFDAFSDMLKAVRDGTVDAATANISITSEREQVLDFSQPIFSAGLQIMIPAQPNQGASIWRIVTSPDLLTAVFLAFGLLFGGGMLMWRLEHGRQPYFEQPAREALFPSFWWALNLVVNGGFEERVPRSPLGRVFGVVLVVSSLFLVSLFVAKITSMMTVAAISSSVNGVNDLYGKRIGTVDGSTAAGFLERRDLQFAGFGNPGDLIEAFERGDLEAVVFDAPILAYYVNTEGRDVAQLAGPVFLRESYGFALPSGSPLTEGINQALLNLREDGSYGKIKRKWFGAGAD